MKLKNGLTGFFVGGTTDRWDHLETGFIPVTVPSRGQGGGYTVTTREDLLLEQYKKVTGRDRPVE